MKKALALLLAFCLALGLRGTAFAAKAAAQSDSVDIVAAFADIFPVDARMRIRGNAVPTTNKLITFSLVDAGTTGATLTQMSAPHYFSCEYDLEATAQGTVILKGVLANGLGDGVDFEKLFTVQVGPGLVLTKNFKTLGVLSRAKKYRIIPANALGATSFQTSDPKVVTVDRDGYITAKTSKNSSAVITVTTSAGQSASITVHVKHTWYEWILEGFFYLIAGPVLLWALVYSVTHPTTPVPKPPPIF